MQDPLSLFHLLLSRNIVALIIMWNYVLLFMNVPRRSRPLRHQAVPVTDPCLVLPEHTDQHAQTHCFRSSSLRGDHLHSLSLH